MKRFIKISVSLICAISCLIISGFAPSRVEVNAANYSGELKEIYLSDFGIEDGSYTGIHTGAYTGGNSLVGTIFTMDLKSSGSELCFSYAATDMWIGMMFHVQPNQMILTSANPAIVDKGYYFYPDVAGVSFKDETFRLQISLEACDSDSDRTIDDLKIGIYYNYVLYNNTFIYVKDAVNAIGNTLNFIPNPYSETEYSCYEISSPKKSNSDNYYAVTPSDFGISDGQHNGTVSDINVGLDGKLMSTELQFENHGDYFDYSGIKLYADSFDGLTIADNSGNNSFANISLSSTVEADLTPITLSSFGISDGLYNFSRYALGNYANSNTLDNTYFTSKIKFAQNDYVPSICYGGTADAGHWGGLQINFTADEISVRDTFVYNYPYVLHPQDVGLTTFENVEFELGVSIRYVDYDNDGEKDDVQYGVRFNGELIGNNYAYVTDFVGQLRNSCFIYCSGENNDKTSSMTASSTDLTKPDEKETINPFEKFNLEIFTKSVDADNDASKDDLDVNFYINSDLVADFTVADYSNKLTNKLAVKGNIVNTEKKISYKDTVLSFSDFGIDSENSNKTSAFKAVSFEEPKVISGNADLSDGGNLKLSIESGAPTLSFSDFGIADGDYYKTNSVSGHFGSAISNYCFSARLNFKSAASFYYAGVAANKGISFNLVNTALVIKDASGNQIARITAQNAGLGTTMRNNEFTLGVAACVADTDNDTLSDDVKLGVWFNEKFYESYDIIDGAKDFGGYVSLDSTSSANKVSVKSYNAQFDKENLIKIIPNIEFSNITDLTFKENNGTISVSGLVNTVLDIDVDALGFDASIKTLSLDDDRKTDDIVLTLYIDGEAVNNRSYFIKNIGSVLAPVINISYSNAKLSDRMPEDGLEEKVYSLHLGDFALSAVGNVWINRQSGHKSGELIKTPGEYVIVRTHFGEEYAQKVDLWKIAHVNSDDAVNVLDFIAMEKYILGSETAAYRKKGADLNFDGNVTAKDTVLMKRILLGIDPVPTEALNDKWSFREDVMPIIGHFAPTAPYIEAESGHLTPNLCTDEVYKAISDVGINFLSYIESQYNEFNMESNLKNLEFATKYGLGAMVWLYIDDNWNQKHYLDVMGRFSHYDSFEGLVVVDEPSSATYPDFSGGDGLAGMAPYYQKTSHYTNFYGYANLLPYVRGYAGEDAEDNTPDNDDIYRKYMQDFCEQFNPKVLSWDYYVLNFKDYLYYYKNLGIAREVAQQYNIPFWAFLQTGDTLGRINNATVTTKEQMLWNLNTMLAYGVKGIQYYYVVQPYWAAYDKPDFETFDFNAAGLIGANGEKTQYYDHALAANKQIMAVDHVLMNSDSKAVLAIGNTAKAETEITADSYGSLKSAFATANRGAIIGCFDYRGKEAFYVSSNSFDEAQQVTLRFDKAHKLSVISADKSEEYTGSRYTIDLDKGEGVLIVLD